MVKLKSAEKALRESEERYRLLFETSRDAIMTLEPPSWNFTSGNAAAFKLFGVKDEKTFVSAPPWKYSPGFQPDGQSSANKAKKMIGIAMEKGSSFFEWTHKKLNGGDFFTTVLLARMSIGEKTFLQATVRDITERKKAERKLRESEEKYRALIETTDTGFVIIDVKGIVMDANSEYVRLTGQQTLKKILGKSVVEWTAEHDKERNAEEVKKCFEQGFTKNLEIDYVDRAGKFTPIEINATVVETMRGLSIVTLCRDITERKRAEKELKKYRERLEDIVESRTAKLKKEISERKLAEKELHNSENKHKTLLENLPQKVFLLDRNLVFVSCNESFVRDKKIRPEEIVGKTDYDFFPKELAEKYRADDKRIIKSGKTEEIEDKRVINGKELVEYTVKCPARDERGKIIGLLGISWDITGHKEVEGRIRESEKRFRQVVGNAHELIWEVDAQGLYTYTSPAIEKILGYKSKEVVGKKHFYDLFHPEDREALKKSAFAVFAKRNSFSEFTNRNISKNGKTVWLSTSGIPILNKKRELLGYRGADTNITEYKQIEKRLKETAMELQEQKLALEQKNIALSEIIAQIEVEKRKMKDDIATNVNELLFPILEKLELENTAGKYVDLLKNHLEELVSSFGRKIRGKRLNLTSREIEICNMIKGRLTSKEISSLLNISYQTVEKHRKNIRRKMGISKKDINLTSLLQSI